MNSNERIRQVLEGLGLEDYLSNFSANDVDDSLIDALTDDDLQMLGITSLGHRKKILAGLASERPQPSTAEASAP